MSVIFGVLKREGDRVVQEELVHLAGHTQDLAADGTFLRTERVFGFGYQPFHTTCRSRADEQPATDIHGNVLLFDGRLDNARELDRMLGIDGSEHTDSELVLFSFVRWGEEFFSRLIGDWALALWCGGQKKLYLARATLGLVSSTGPGKGANWSGPPHCVPCLPAIPARKSAADMPHAFLPAK